MTYNENFYKIIKTGTYIGEYEIINTCLEFRCNICLYKLEKDKNNNLIYKFETLKSIQERFNPFIPIILFAWVNNNHYELLIPIDLSLEEYPLENSDILKVILL